MFYKAYIWAKLTMSEEDAEHYATKVWKNYFPKSKTNNFPETKKRKCTDSESELKPVEDSCSENQPVED